MSISSISSRARASHSSESRWSSTARTVASPSPTRGSWTATAWSACRPRFSPGDGRPWEIEPLRPNERTGRQADLLPLQPHPALRAHLPRYRRTFRVALHPGAGSGIGIGRPPSQVFALADGIVMLHWSETVKPVESFVTDRPRPRSDPSAECSVGRPDPGAGPPAVRQPFTILDETAIPPNSRSSPKTTLSKDRPRPVHLYDPRGGRCTGLDHGRPSLTRRLQRSSGTSRCTASTTSRHDRTARAVQPAWDAVGHASGSGS